MDCVVETPRDTQTYDQQLPRDASTLAMATDGTYWLALVQLDDGRSRPAFNWFTRRVSTTSSDRIGRRCDLQRGARSSEEMETLMRRFED